jgi:hypothetical protein
MATRKGSDADPSVRFEHGLPAHIMSIDGTWRRDCVVNDVSEMEATLTVTASIEGLQLKEIFLLLSSTGLANRRCSLAWVNGAQIGVKFLWQNGKKGSRRFYYEPVSLSPELAFTGNIDFSAAKQTAIAAVIFSLLVCSSLLFSLMADR